MRLLIDTNVILDVLMEREPFCRSAQAVLMAVAEEKAQGFITASSVTDLYYLLRKHLHSQQEAKQALMGLLAVVEVLDVTGSDCERAFELQMPDYEDALLAWCAKRHKIDRIVTRNQMHFEGSPVQTVLPDDLLRNL